MSYICRRKVMDRKKISRTIGKLCDDMDDAGGAMLAIVSDSESGEYYAFGDMTLVREGVSNLLEDSGKDSGMYGVAYAIVNGLVDAMRSGFDPSAFMEREDVEDCASCEMNMTCTNEAAERYRNENGLCITEDDLAKKAN